MEQAKINAGKQNYQGDGNSDILIKVVTSYGVDMGRM